MQPALCEHQLTSRLQIVYVSIVGLVMIAALIEWLLGLAAFLYCLIKVFQKAEDRSTRVLAIILMIVFSALRYVARPCPIFE